MRRTTLALAALAAAAALLSISCGGGGGGGGGGPTDGSAFVHGLFLQPRNGTPVEVNDADISFSSDPNQFNDLLQ